MHEQGQAFKEHVSKIVRDTKASISSTKWKPAMAGVPNDFAKISDDAKDIAKTHSMVKAEGTGNVGDVSTGKGTGNGNSVHRNIKLL
ncbi:MAG: hypothetical protein ABF629_13090 [Sporolactobacillus sp.]